MKTTNMLILFLIARNHTAGMRRHDQSAGGDRRRGGDRSSQLHRHNSPRTSDLCEGHQLGGVPVVAQHPGRLPQVEGSPQEERHPAT